jgi:hypothetical protein
MQTWPSYIGRWFLCGMIITSYRHGDHTLIGCHDGFNNIGLHSRNCKAPHGNDRHQQLRLCFSCFIIG